MSQSECYNAIKELIDYGADLDILYDDFGGQYPLVYAAMHRYTDSVELLLDYGANPDVKDSPGLTALMEASNMGYPEIAQLLLENGANPNIPNRNGDTALDYANAMTTRYPIDKTEIAELLKEYMKLWSDQKLSYMSALNPRLGRDSPFNYLDYDMMQILEKYLNYNPNISKKYGKEKQRNKYTKSRQRLSLLKGLEDRDSLFGHMTSEPGVFELISKHVSHMKPVHSIQEQMLLEDRQMSPDEKDIDPFTDESEVDNWTECYDCGKPLYLGKYSDYVGEEYFPTLIDEKWYCSDCAEERKVMRGGFRKKTFRRRYRL